MLHLHPDVMPVNYTFRVRASDVTLQCHCVSSAGGFIQRRLAIVSLFGLRAKEMMKFCDSEDCTVCRHCSFHCSDSILTCLSFVLRAHPLFYYLEFYVLFKVAVRRIVAQTIAAVKFKTLQCVVSPPSSLNWLPGG